MYRDEKVTFNDLYRDYDFPTVYEFIHFLDLDPNTVSPNDDINEHDWTEEEILNIFEYLKDIDRMRH